MLRTTKILFAATLLGMLTTQAHAATFHYNVDDQTLPGGPVELVQLDDFDFVDGDGLTDQYTFHFGAKNNGGTVQQDVLFLLQFAFDPSLAYTFNDGVDTWTGNDNTLSYVGLSTYSMSDTDAPLLWTKLSPTRTGTLLASDTIPYVQIGDIPGGGTVPFDLVVQVNEDFANFSVVGSFVAVPEPSSLALMSLGALGLLVARRVRSRK